MFYDFLTSTTKLALHTLIKLSVNNNLTHQNTKLTLLRNYFKKLLFTCNLYISYTLGIAKLVHSFSH